METEFERIERIEKEMAGKTVYHEIGLKFEFGKNSIQVFHPFHGKVIELSYEDLPARFNPETGQEVEELPGMWTDDDIIVTEHCIII